MAITTKAEISNHYKSCSLCPRQCGVDREKARGFCGETSTIRISRAALHMWEEPCISGESGSGTIFFSGCQLKCSFCQNNDIALSKRGGEISVPRLAEIFFELRDQGANNINFVTPSHFAPSIIEAISIAREKGFSLPFVYNCGGYESPQTIKMLNGYIDIFLPDFKYFDPETAERYSHAKNYPDVAKKAIEEMVKIAGKPVYDENGIMKKGVIVRHLILPSHYKESIDIVKYLYTTYNNDIVISIMNQYTPMECETHAELKRKLTQYEYNKVIDAAAELGITNAYIQEGETQSDSFIPPFDMSGVYRQ